MCPELAKKRRSPLTPRLVLGLGLQVGGRLGTCGCGLRAGRVYGKRETRVASGRLRRRRGPGYESSVSLPHKNQHQQRSLSLAAYPNPHASPLAQRARKAETGPDAVLKLAQRTQRTTATRTAAGLPSPDRASGVQTATPETSSSGGPYAPPAARKRTRMPGTITPPPPSAPPLMAAMVI